VRKRFRVGEVEQTITVGEAAELLDLSPTMIKKLIRAGRLQAYKTRIGHLVSRRSVAAERRRRAAQ